VIFNLKGVLVGKDYFKINHLLPPMFNLTQIHTLLSKSVVPRLNVREFLLRCLEQFIIYIWTSTMLNKMNTYLRKITKKMGIEVDLQRIIGQDLCKINKHFLHFPFKRNYKRVDRPTHDKKIYHKNLSYLSHKLS
jgi:hypothetical protein